MTAQAEVAKTSFPAIVSGFGYSPIAPAIWRADPASTLQFRSLSLDQASSDVLLSRHLRSNGLAVETAALGDPSASFAFVFVLKGKLVMRAEGREPVTLNALDSATRYGTGPQATWSFSHDAEVVEIVAGPDGAPMLGFDGNPQAGAWVINADEESGYVIGEGPRRFFRYRDLGVAAATNRRIHIHVVRSTKAVDGGTGWHSHSMGQLFYVLRGWADLAVERQPWVRMNTGDAMCVAPRMAHDVPAFSSDYLVLEMCIPADYDTVDTKKAN